MNNLDKQYTALLQDILDNGVKKETRNGGTLSVFGRQIRHKMSEGFPLLTTKKMYMKGIITELLWFLRGDTNIKYLVDNDCHIWDGDAYKNYQKYTLGECDKKWLKEKDGMNLGTGEFTKVYCQFTPEEFINKIKTDDEFAKKWGELGPIYGKQWRSWGKPIGIGHSGGISMDGARTNNTPQIAYDTIDQIANLINDLKTNPDSRRLMVNAWNLGELDGMVLPPCHYGFQVYTRELSLEERLKISGIEINNQMSFIDYTSILDGYNIPTRAISLMWNQRSVDTFLGLPFNIASYGLLLEIIAKEVNMVPDELIGNLGDTHLYLNHIEQAKEQIGRELTLEERYNLWTNKENKSAVEYYNNISSDLYKHAFLSDRHQGEVPRRTREPYPLPKLWINDLRTDSNSIINDIRKWSASDFKIENYQSHPAIKAPLSN